MSLRENDFRIDYNKNQHDIANEFYLPCMNNAVRYDRLTGYFSSYIFTIAWIALKGFVQNGGTIRIICSSNLSGDDIEAMSKGYDSRGKDLCQKNLQDEINTLVNNPILSKPTRLLSCLIGLNIASFKIAIICNDQLVDIKRLFHDKVGVFTDSDGDSVVFRGSMNETFSGLSSDGNIESISVYKSWNDNNDAKRAENANIHFDSLWNDLIPGISVIDFSDTIVETTKAKYPDEDWEVLLQETLSDLLDEKKWYLKNGVKTIVPYLHQLEALKNWERQGRRGILEHATGSGKTITGICAINDAHRRGEIAIVLLPSIELLDQWYREIRKTMPAQVRTLVCGGNDTRWKDDSCIESWTRKFDSKPRIILSTIGTATTESFVSRINPGDHLFLVIDEVHRIGSPKARSFLNLETGARLGLSATPTRFGDMEGTLAIYKYFQGVVPPPFTIGDAIKLGVLTKYFYYPHAVHLTYEEQEEWSEITKRINRFIGQHSDPEYDVLSSDYLKSLLIARSRIIKNAASKVNLALKVLEENYQPGQRWLLYCDNQKQMNSVLDLINGNGFQACEYHSAMSGDRKETMRQFLLQGGVLVSIKCLDEGVDIPSATHALILASSKNPREFIQRRGRVLRRAENKHYAYLYDAIVLPIDTDHDESYSFIMNELYRSMQFGESADNPDCLARIRLLAIEQGIKLDADSDGGLEDDEILS